MNQILSEGNIAIILIWNSLHHKLTKLFLVISYVVQIWFMAKAAIVWIDGCRRNVFCVCVVLFLWVVISWWSECKLTVAECEPITNNLTFILIWVVTNAWVRCWVGNNRVLTNVWVVAFNGVYCFQLQISLNEISVFPEGSSDFLYFAGRIYWAEQL